MALKLLIVIAFVFLAGAYIPYTIKSGLYGLSLSIKEVLLFTMPFVIFSCLFSCILSFKDKALMFMLMLFMAVFASNAIGLYYGYGVGYFGLNFLNISFTKIECSANQLLPLWDLGIKPFISNEIALLTGSIGGFIFAVVKSKKVLKFSNFLNRFISIFLNKCFIPVLPLFALGYLLKMQHEGVLVIIFKTYGPILLLLIVALILYLGLMFLVSSGFKFNKAISYIKNALPAAITGFSTMSGMAALPANLIGAEKNTNDPDTVRAVIPACTNIHMVGDSVIVPVLAMVILLTFGKELPDFAHYSIFLGFFLFVKLSIVGVPGGGIIFAIPLLEEHFGFTGEMSALISTIYILFDPIDTTANVLGNNSFSIIMSKLFHKRNRKQHQEI